MTNPAIKIKRSAVAGKIPTSDQVPLGELALNTFDGHLFASKNVGVGTIVFAVNPWLTGVGTNTYNTYFNKGNAGINNASPTSKLDVVGDTKISGIVTATSFSGQINTGVGTITSSTLVTSTTSETAIATLNASSFRSAVFQVQVVRGTNYNMTTVNVLHDGTNTYMTEYGTINHPTGISTFSTDINSGSLRLLAYPSSSSDTTFKVLITAIQV